MRQRRPSDLFNSLFLIGASVLLVALVVFRVSGPGFISSIEYPHWKNLYLEPVRPSLSDDGLLLFVIFARCMRDATNQSSRVWLGWLVVLTGLAGVVLAASLAPSLIPHLALTSCAMALMAGVAFPAFLAYGVPGQVLHKLFADTSDYAARFFPVTGSLLCLALLGLWGWALYERWIAHDYTAVSDVTCFMLGIIGVLVAGRSRQATPQSDDGASCAI